MDKEYGQIEKLGNNNFSSWTEDMKAVLMEKDLWGILNGQENVPEKEADVKEVRLYNSKNNRTYSTIYLNIEKEYRVLISDTEDGKTAWNKLQEHFRPDSRARVVGLTDEFFSCRIEENEEIGLYAAKLQNIINQLKDAGNPIPDWFQSFQLIRYLSPEYTGIVLSIYRWEDSRFKFDKVLKELLAEEARLKLNKEDKAVMLNSTLERQNQKSKPRKHNSFGEIKECQICNKKGHATEQCWFKDKNKNSKRKKKYNKRKPKSHFVVETAYNVNLDSNSWIFDTAASTHFCGNKALFSEFKVANNTKMSVAIDGVSCKIDGTGTVILKFKDKDDFKEIRLDNVMYSKRLRRNLLAGPKLDKQGYSFKGGKGKFEIINNTGAKVCTANMKNGLYYLYPTHAKSDEKITEKHKSKEKSQGLEVRNFLTIDEEKGIWHRRFCHINQDYVFQTSKVEAVHGLPKFKNTNQVKCDTCKLAKTRRKSFKGHQKIRSKAPLELLHMDVCGPMPTKSINQDSYFLTITDDFSRKVYIYPMKHKSEVMECFRKFQARAERFLNKKIINIRTDNGMEFCHKNFKQELEKQGIKAERTNFYTPEQNGVAERLNYTALNGVKAILKESGLENKFWTEALFSFVYVWNRVCHGNDKQTPFEKYGGRKPSVKHLKVIGAKAFVGVPRNLRNKLQMRAKEGILVGYALQTKGYRVWLPKEKKIIETINVSFDEERVKENNSSGAMMGPKFSSRQKLESSENETDTESESSDKSSLNSDETDNDFQHQEIGNSDIEDSEYREEIPRVESDNEIDEPQPSTSSQSEFKWFRKAVPRPNCSRTDIYYNLSGTGNRLRSINDVKKYCESKNLPFEKELFDFNGKNKYTGIVGEEEANES